MNKKIYLCVFLSFFFFYFSNAQLTLSGKVLRHNGEPLEGVTVNCTNAFSTISGADGSFSFSNLPEGESYNITGDFETDYFDDVSILDLLVMNDHILSINPFESFYPQWLAGDLSLDGGISAIDMVYTNFIILRLDEISPDPYWRFFDIASGGIPFAEEGISLENLNEDSTNLNLIGVKKADMAIAADHMPPPNDAPNPIYFIEDTSANQNEEIEVNIKVNDFREIAGFQHGLNWNTNDLEFLSFEHFTPFSVNVNDEITDEGDFLISAANLGFSTDLDDGEVLYSLRFKVLQNLNTIAESINFSTSIIPLQTVYRRFEMPYGLFLIEDTYEDVVSSYEQISSFQYFKIIPNPSRNETLIDIAFSQVEEGAIALYNISGKHLNSWRFVGSSFQKEINIQNLTKGVYILKIITENGLVTKRLVKQ